MIADCLFFLYLSKKGESWKLLPFQRMRLHEPKPDHSRSQPSETDIDEAKNCKGQIETRGQLVAVFEFQYFPTRN